MVIVGTPSIRNFSREKIFIQGEETDGSGQKSRLPVDGLFNEVGRDFEFLPFVLNPCFFGPLFFIFYDVVEKVYENGQSRHGTGLAFTCCPGIRPTRGAPGAVSRAAPAHDG